MITTVSQDDAFGRQFLDKIVDWIPGKFDPEDIFSKDRLIKWATSEGLGEVFTRDEVDEYLDDYGLKAVDK